MYEPYPSSGASQAGLAPEPVQQPLSVRTAVRLMWLAAGVEVVALIIALLTRGALQAAILSRHPHYTATQLHNAETAQTVTLVVGALIAVALWLWMAWLGGGVLLYGRIQAHPDRPVVLRLNDARRAGRQAAGRDAGAWMSQWGTANGYVRALIRRQKITSSPVQVSCPVLRLWLLEPGFPTRSRRRTDS
jgi:hypothetical protein